MLAIVTRHYDPASQIGPESVRYHLSIVTNLTPNEAGHVPRECVAVYEDPDMAFRLAERVNVNLAAWRSVSAFDGWATIRQTLGR